MTVFEAAGLMPSENMTETIMLRTPDQTTLSPPLVGQRYTQTAQFLYLRGIIDENPESPNAEGRGVTWLRAERFARLRATHYRVVLRAIGFQH